MKNISMQAQECLCWFRKGEAAEKAHGQQRPPSQQQQQRTPQPPSATARHRPTHRHYDRAFNIFRDDVPEGCPVPADDPDVQREVHPRGLRKLPTVRAIVADPNFLRGAERPPLERIDGADAGDAEHSGAEATATRRMLWGWQRGAAGDVIVKDDERAQEVARRSARGTSRQQRMLLEKLRRDRRRRRDLACFLHRVAVRQSRNRAPLRDYSPHPPLPPPRAPPPCTRAHPATAPPAPPAPPAPGAGRSAAPPAVRPKLLTDAVPSQVAAAEVNCRPTPARPQSARLAPPPAAPELATPAAAATAHRHSRPSSARVTQRVAEIARRFNL